MRFPGCCGRCLEALTALLAADLVEGLRDALSSEASQRTPLQEGSP